MAVAVRMAISVAVGACDLHGLHGSAGNRHLNLLNRANLYDGLGGLLQYELFVNPANLGSFLVGLATAGAIFLGRGKRNVVLEMPNAGRIVFVDAQRMLVAVEVNFLALGEDFVLAVLLLPLGHSRVLIHVLYNLPPSDAGVVSAEGNFALLRGVRNDAHFGAAEVVVEKILEPHSREEQEVPRVLAALHGVIQGAIRADLSVNLFSFVLTSHAEGLVKFLPKILEPQARRGLERMIVFQERHGSHVGGKFLAAGRVCNLADVSDEPRDIEELRDRRPFLVFLVDHHRRTHAAIRGATTAHLSPHGIGGVGQVREIREWANERDGEPVASRFDSAHLSTDVLSQVRKRVALAQTSFRSDFFVAPGEGNGLERNERDLLGVLHRELHDRANLIVIHVVDDGGNQHDIDASCVHVFNRAQFHVEKVAYLTMAVRVVADTIELQVCVAQTRFEGLGAEVLALGELDSVRRGLHAVVADFARKAHGIQETRMHGGFAAGGLHGHMTARFALGGGLEDFLTFFPVQFVNVDNLVRVHEAGIPQYVAAVGQVHGEHGAAAVANSARTVPMHVFIVVRRDVATGEILFNPFEEL